MKISELIPDDRNANKGTKRGRGMLEKSLQNYGAGRSLVCDKNGRLISGNKTAEALESVGLTDVILVESDGTRAVVVKRTDLDLDSPKGRGLAIADNRVGEVGLEWDSEVLNDLPGVDLEDFWSDGELPGGTNEANPYTQKIKSPIYEPKYDTPPSLEKLCDAAKTEELLKQIASADIPEDVRGFLEKDAQRHLMFNY